MQIALLEDDATQVELLKLWLQESADDLQAFSTGHAFRQALCKNKFDLLIIDWHLPDTSGIDELKWIRQEKKSEVPIIFITSRDSEESIVTALDHGADDYIVKPVKQAETLSRIKALQRRADRYTNSSRDEPGATIAPENNTAATEHFGLFEFDYKEYKVFKEGTEISLTRKEFELACYLFRNSGSLLTREFLLQYVWGTTVNLNTRTVDTHISRIRSKLGITPEAGWQLNSIYQRGYRLNKIV